MNEINKTEKGGQDGIDKLQIISVLTLMAKHLIEVNLKDETITEESQNTLTGDKNLIN